jgi:hypothetical protein
VSAPASDALSALLAAYLDPHLASAGRLLDVPPPVAAQALDLLPPDRRPPGSTWSGSR